MDNRAVEYSTITDTSAIVDGVRIALSDYGDGQPVVFLHGPLSHSFLWRNVVSQVQQAGYRTIAYDLLGDPHDSRFRGARV